MRAGRHPKAGPVPGRFPSVPQFGTSKLIPCAPAADNVVAAPYFIAGSAVELDGPDISMVAGVIVFIYPAHQLRQNLSADVGAYGTAHQLFDEPGREYINGTVSAAAGRIFNLFVHLAHDSVGIAQYDATAVRRIGVKRHHRGGAGLG